MNYTEVLQNILRAYNLSEPLLCTEDLHSEEDTGRIYKITYVQTKTKKLVISLSRRKERTKQAIEESVAFANFLRANGVPTPRYYSTTNGFRHEVRIDGLTASVTVNDYEGEPLPAVDEDSAFEIGALLGKMHALGLQYPHPVTGKDVLFDGFCGDWDGASVLKELDKQQKLPHSKYLRCRRAVGGILQFLQGRQASLPRATVQGNVGLGHISKADKLYVYGFENAGDCCLLTDFVLQGMTLALSSPCSGESLGGELYCTFEDGYFSERTLTDEERDVYDIFVNYAQTMWKDSFNRSGGLCDLAERDGNACDGYLKSLYRELEGLLS